MGIAKSVAFIASKLNRGIGSIHPLRCRTDYARELGGINSGRSGSAGGARIRGNAALGIYPRLAALLLVDSRARLPFAYFLPRAGGTVRKGCRPGR